MNGESGIFVADRGSENKRYGREKGTLLKSRHAKVYLNSSYFRIRFFPIENIRWRRKHICSICKLYVKWWRECRFTWSRRNWHYWFGRRDLCFIPRSRSKYSIVVPRNKVAIWDSTCSCVPFGGIGRRGVHNKVFVVRHALFMRFFFRLIVNRILRRP